MTNTNITIEANFPTNGNCKRVKDLTTGKEYGSITETAITLKVTGQAVSSAIRNNSYCKGHKLMLVKDLHDNIEALCEENAKANKRADKYEAKLKSMEEEMAEYRLWKAEREAEAKRIEAERKAKEDHEKAIAKAKAKIEMYTAECERREAKLQLAVGKLMAAEMELKALEEGVC